MVLEKNEPLKLSQVCYELNKENTRREAGSLFDAMNFFKMKKGVILTFNHKDVIVEDGKRIDVIPVHEYQF